MIRVLRINITFIIFLALAFELKATIVTGRVTCGGLAVTGVSVSDGRSVVYTGTDGTYSINTPLDMGYVFISVPSGYEVPAQDNIPQFFRRLDASQRKAVADFELVLVDQNKCNIIVFNDIHLTGDPVYHDLEQVHRGFFADVNEHYKDLNDVPVYAMTLGDMTTDSRWYKWNFALPEYLCQMVDNFPVPIWHTMGNHDNDIKGGSDDAASRAFRNVIGPHYYSFNIGAFHFIVLDDIVYDMPLNEQGRVAKVNTYKTYVAPEQLSWLKNDLKNVPANTPVVILTHAPFYRIKGLEDGKYIVNGGFNAGHTPDDVLYFLRKYDRVYVLSGHTHMNYYVENENGVMEHNCVSVAGSSWYTESAFGRNFSSDGVPAGYAVYTIDGRELSWYYKPVGIEMEDCQFRAYDMNVVPSEFKEDFPENSVLVNVFNYDPAWKVSVREEGKEVDVTQVWTWDPLYAAGVKGHSFSKKGAFRPNRNSHMFLAQPSSATSPVEIIVTDRFGRIYRHTMTRPGKFSIDMPVNYPADSL